MYKLIVSDLDGTLLNDCDQVSTRNRKTIARLFENGYLFSIATGRILSSAKIIAADLDLKDPIIACNGAVIYDFGQKKTLYKQPIQEIDALNILKLAKSFDVSLNVYDENTYFTDKIADNVLKYIEKNKTVNQENQVKIRLIPDLYAYFSSKPHELLKIQFNSPNRDTLDKIAQILSDQEAITVTSSWSSNLEIMHSTVSKAAAVAKLASILNVNHRDLICFGDHENDIPMLKIAGMGVAMANASDQVKNSANHVTGANTDDGFAFGIQKLLIFEN
ncbi:MAG: Cof-type HAD-IIB family hydrolase [Eubacteriaceae bacterium]|jgi:hypothetical protein